MYCFEWYDNIEIALTRTPVFIFGLFMGKDIAEKKNISFVLVISGFLVKLTSILLVGFDLIIGEYAKELNRFANGLYSIALIIVISYLICCIKSDIINKSLYKIGEYSLELYLSHVTVRTIFIICGISTAILFNYIICILISILLSILLHRLSEIVIYKVKF